MFQTKVEIPKSNFNIAYEDRVMTLGSCFAENIGQRMQKLYFYIDVNPFGVLYNPVSIRNSIDLLIENRPFTHDNVLRIVVCGRVLHIAVCFRIQVLKNV